MKNTGKTLINSNMFYKIIDFFNLLLVMFLSYNFFNSVLFGCISYLFVSLLILGVQIFIRSKDGVYLKGAMLVALVLTLINAILISINKEELLSILTSKDGLNVFLFTLMLLLRGLITNDLICKLKVNFVVRSIFRMLIHALFIGITIDYLLNNFTSTSLFISLFVVCSSSIAMLLVQMLNKGNLVDIKPLNKVRSIHTFKILSRNLFVSYLGFYMSLLLFIITVSMNSLYYTNENFLNLSFCFIIGSLIAYVVYRILSKRNVYDLTYVLGFVISFVSYILLNCLDNYKFVFIIPFLLGEAIMFGVIRGIQKKILLLNGLDEIQLDEDMIQQNKTANHNAALAISIGVALIYIYVAMVPTLNQIVLYSPLVLLLICCLYALRQPIDKDTYLYLLKFKKGKYEELFLNKLRRKFVEKNKRRWFILFLKRFFKLVLNHKVVGKENVTEDDMPAIFVSNHGEYYGPIAAVANMPYTFRPWIESQLLEPEKGYPYTYKYTFSLITWLPVCIRKLLAKITVNVIANIFSALDPVPVYRSELRSIFKTFNLSVEALKEGDNILLFPESTHNTEDGKYAKDGNIGDFFTGFAHIGVKYFEATGKQIKFYPIYLDKKKRRFIIGKCIEFNSTNDRSLEKKRLAIELRNSMENLRTF